MAGSTLMDKLKSFLGLRQEPPKNDFRNPIWGSDDDEDDGDELYTRHMDQYVDPAELQRHITKQMHDMFKSFGSMFGEMKVFFNDDQFAPIADFADVPEPEGYNGNSIRDYYLKPGYQNRKQEQIQEDVDLDGKISSQEISGLLKQKEDGQKSVTPFNGNLVPGRSFCQTIITTSVTKPDGTIETRRIIKNGNEVIEETTTSSASDPRGLLNSGLDQISAGFMSNNFMSELSSLFRNFY